ncbi:spore-associated protein A [Actinoallomurus liliacearum]|uniref:Spore-associated protein A n=2 Tax=Actinoallomurus TaxID=667113 RepID=A0ABP8TMZ7_9ACTN
MKKALRTLVAGAAVAGGIAGGVALASPASAATPAGVCGSGYSQIDKHTMSGSTIYLLFNGSSNCVVTFKTTSVGKATRTGAYLQVSGKTPVEDTDDYTTYAGPVRQSAAGKCIVWGGGTSAGGFWYSGWSHCG